MTEPSWQPDPTGRNHYRWWDGANWSDSVSNNGQTAIDPVVPVVAAPVVQQPTPQPAMQPPVLQQPVAQPAAQPMGAQPAQTFPGTTTVVPAAAAPAKKSGLPKWLIPVAAAVAVGVGLFFFLGGDDDKGGGKFGVTEAEIKAGAELIPLEFNMKKGDVIRIRLEPGDDDLDTIGLILADSKTSKAFAEGAQETFEADGLSDVESFFSDPADFFSDLDVDDFSKLVSVQAVDIGFSGEADADFFVAFADGKYTLVVGPSNPEATGEVRIIVEKLPSALDLADIESFSDFDSFTSDNDDFFSDTRFFSSDRTFNP